MNTEAIKTTNAKMLRLKAEEQLKARFNDSIPTQTESDTRRLLHELQVHQIELEMQNEELQNAYETAETALRKYTLLYDLAPMGYFTLDSDARILELNFTGAEIVKERRFSLIGNNFRLYVEEESLQLFNEFINSLFSSHEKESCVITLGYKNTLLSHAYLEGIVTGEDRHCLLSVVDLSEIKKLVQY